MQIGDIFDGRYQILKILGQGGMGRVYLAININTDTYWAIKEITKKEGEGFELPAESKLLKKLEHPALPRLFDILEQDGKLYLISDYIEGKTLEKKLDEEGKIPENTVIDWAIQLCSALAYLHEQKPNPIIYRDMKPSNIILSVNGTLKLIDFGIAREFKSQSQGDTVYIGTRGYAAPEQYGTGQTSPASDIFSLGVTMHRLLTGKNPSEPPFGLKPVRYFDESLSTGIETIISKCTKENANERYQSAGELLEALKKLTLKTGIPETDGFDSINEKTPFNENQNTCRQIKQFSYKKMVISIWDNAEFGCELAYMAAKHTKGEVLLADMDMLAPKADLSLNIKKYPGKAVQDGIFGHSGLDIVMDAVEKGTLTTELLKQSLSERKDIKNLHILTGSYRLDNYEYYNEESVPKLIDKFYRAYDITILLLNRSIYDAFTLAALLSSDINIVAVKGEIAELREFNSYIAFLKDKQELPFEKNRFILYEYDKTTGLSFNEIKEATMNNLLGKVSQSRRRAMYRNLNGAYAARMENNIENEYIRLLKKLELLPETAPLRKIGTSFGRYIGIKLKSLGKPAAM